VSVRIHKTGQNHFARAINLVTLRRFFLSQGSRSASLVLPTETILPPRQSMAASSRMPSSFRSARGVVRFGQLNRAESKAGKY
jgi:hypothetical protein